LSERKNKIMKRRRKKPDGKHYGFWHQGRHADEGVLEASDTDMPLYASEPHGETSTYQPDTMTFPQRRAPLWVTLSVLGVAILVSSLVAIQMISGASGTPPTAPPAAVIVRPDVATASPKPARTVRVAVPGPTTTVRIPVPGPTVTVTASPTPSPVPGPTVTVTRTIKPKAPKPVRVTVTVTVPGPTVTETVTAEPPALPLP
jgi:hypothetical protein